MVLTPVPIAKVWAERKPLLGTRTGAEIFAAQQIVASAEVRWRIRWPQGFMPTADESCHLIDLGDGDREHDILSVIEIGRREGLEILTKARADSDSLPS
jgi:hypothetical protein